MKVLAVFSLLVMVVTAYPVVKTWTLTELSEAIETSKADPSLTPYLEDALNQIMLALFTGKNETLIHAVVPSPTGGATWTVEQLTTALADPNTKPDYRPSLMQALAFVKQKNETGEIQDSVEVAIPALDISTWTQADVIEALKSPSTKPELIPYLEKARAELKHFYDTGANRETVSLVTPVGLIPHKADYEFIPKASKRFIKKTKKGI